MFRKNSQERTRSAGTRVASSKKIPSDFFTPSKKSPKQNGSQNTDSSNTSFTIPFAKRVSDSMLFTFNRENSSKQLQVSAGPSHLKKTGLNKVAKFPSSTLKGSHESSPPQVRESRLMKASRGENGVRSKVWPQIQ